MKQEEQVNIAGTVYDSVFRTECEHLKPLLIPVINELFRTDYAMEDAGVLRLANEHLLRDHLRSIYRSCMCRRIPWMRYLKRSCIS